MARLDLPRERMMPRMRAYLARAGEASRVCDARPELASIARKVYEEAFSAALPIAYARDVSPAEFPTELPRELEDCASYTLMVFSLGRGFDKAAEELFERGETLRGALFDAWGSEAVEALAVSVDLDLREARGRGTIRFAPGYSGFDIRHNAAWLAAAAMGTHDCDTPSADGSTGIITPRKSIVCAIGWGNDR